MDSHARTSSGDWRSTDELLATTRRSERSLRAKFEEQFPEGGRKQVIRTRWQEGMINLERELLTFAALVADDIRDSGVRTGESERQLLVRNIHLRMGQLAWSAVVDVGGLVLGIVALRSGDMAEGTTGSVLSMANLIRNIHESITHLAPDQVELYRAAARIECERRIKNLEPPFPTESEIIDSVVGQLEGNEEARSISLHGQLSSMIGNSLISKGEGRLAVY